jgi:uncharacterized repeat protein (TIGR03803 family)
MQKSRRLAWFTAVLILASASATATAQQSRQTEGPYKVLHNFQGGLDPLAVVGMVVDEAGTIYGDSALGGPSSCIIIGGVTSDICFDIGAEFKLDHRGEYTLFPNPTTGAGPLRGALGPMLLADGKLIFATISGGDNSTGAGGVFTLNPESGDFATLFSLSGSPTDGAFPGINAIRDPDGNLYGTTLGGGQDSPIVCGFGIGFGLDNGCGTVYKLDAKTHQETVLHTFTFDDGNQPVGLVRDHAGNLIGAASLGADHACHEGFLPIGCGLIFQIDPAGNFNMIHEFHHHENCPFVFGCSPSSGPLPELMGWNPPFVTVDTNGNIFGATGAGGNFGLGVIFKIDSSGNYSVLHHFAGSGDGFATQAILLRNGKLYGINAEGGNFQDCGFGSGCGTLFSVDTRTGVFTVLHTFSNIEEGAAPSALTFDPNGDLVGSNFLGGSAGLFNPNICTGGGGCGNVFRFTLSAQQ